MQKNNINNAIRGEATGESFGIQDHCGDVTSISSTKEITLIETVTSFLEENGASEMDPKVLRNLAEALSKPIDDTSPGALQDVTMDNSYASFDLGRAPGAVVGQSPLVTEGRSVRDLEQQMSALHKENFNLKLRIYFMEENLAGGTRKSAPDPLAKQLIDTKIELETLRKSVGEKTELLKDAARAIAEHEDVQKQTELENQVLIDQLQQQITHLEAEVDVERRQKCLDVPNNAKVQLAEELLQMEKALKQSELERTTYQCQIEEANRALAEREESLNSCEAKIKELAIKNADLVEAVERLNKTQDMANAQMRCYMSENAHLRTRVNELEHELGRQSTCMDEAVFTLDAQRRTIAHLELNMRKRESAATVMFGRLNDFECIIGKQMNEIESLRHDNACLRDLQRRHRQLDRVAVVQPMQATVNPEDGAFGNQRGVNIPRCASGSSLYSNFSAVSILAGGRQPGKQLCNNAGPDAQVQHLPQQQQPQQQLQRQQQQQQLGTVVGSATAIAAYSGAKHGFLQLLAAQFFRISSIPLALGHLALKLLFIYLKLHNSVLCVGEPFYVVHCERPIVAGLALAEVLCTHCCKSNMAQVDRTVF